MRVVRIHCGKKAAKNILRSVYDKQSNAVYASDNLVLGVVVVRAEWTGKYVSLTSLDDDYAKYLPRLRRKYFVEEFSHELP